MVPVSKKSSSNIFVNSYSVMSSCSSFFSKTLYCCSFKAVATLRMYTHLVISCLNIYPLDITK